MEINDINDFVTNFTVYVKKDGSLEVYDAEGNVDFLAPEELVDHIMPKKPKITGISDDYVPGFLNWLARIVLAGYYESRDAEGSGYEDWEVDVLLEQVQHWMEQTGMEKTTEQVSDFMYENRRL